MSDVGSMLRAHDERHQADRQLRVRDVDRGIGIVPSSVTILMSPTTPTISTFMPPAAPPIETLQALADRILARELLPHQRLADDGDLRRRPACRRR